MDHFDRRLELELRHLLDPIVDAPAPRRRAPATLRAIPGGLIEHTAELAIVPETMPIAAPVGTPL